MSDAQSKALPDVPDDLRYASSHEWARLEDGVVTVGVTDFAQQALGDVVFVELPELDSQVQSGVEAGVVESVKAASDIYAPVSGTVVAVNETLEDTPESVNEDPYGDGWFFKVEPDDPAALDELLDADGYAEMCVSEDGDH